MAQVKPQVKILGGLVVIAVLYFGITFGINHGYIPAGTILKSVIPQKANLPSVEDAQVADVKPVAYPTATAVGCDDPIRSEIWAWNAQFGWLYSNGGVDTTKGSIGQKYGVCLHFIRQDDTTLMKNDLLACAKDLANSNECANGVHFITIMADGSGQFLAQYNAEAKKICSDCTAEIVGTTGFSRGEDALWGPATWKASPRSALGDGLVAGVLRDGDWNTAQKWIADNNLKNNPDEKTYDQDAINWVNASDYIKAAEMYISPYCEDRKVIINGHLTGKTQNVCVKGVVTWTPGDVNIAKHRGGIVRIVSTKEYRSQMPSAVIGIKKWNKSHADRVAGMLAATLEGGDQVKAFPEAKKIAGDISAKVYGEQDGAYWLKYYNGSVERDMTGKEVQLGGSYADNLNDALSVFGITPGSNNNVKATYTIFAKIVDQQYHDLFAKTPIPDYKDVATTAYLLQAKGLMDNQDTQSSAADVPSYSADSDTSEQVSDKNVNIDFETGSAALTPTGLSMVKQIKDETAITGLTIVLNGHTDNTGNPDKNKLLSQARAESVKNAMQHMAPKEFPNERFRVTGYGDTRPLTAGSNATLEGRAKNRRVEVILAQ